MSHIQPHTHPKIIGDERFHRYSIKEHIAVNGEDNAMLARLNGGDVNQNDEILTVVHRVCNERNHSGMIVSHLYGNERPYNLCSVHTR